LRAQVFQKRLGNRRNVAATCHKPAKLSRFSRFEYVWVGGMGIGVQT